MDLVALMSRRIADDYAAACDRRVIAVLESRDMGFPDYTFGYTPPCVFPTHAMNPTPPTAPRGGWRVEWQVRHDGSGRLDTGVSWFRGVDGAQAGALVEVKRGDGGTADRKYYAELFGDIELALYGPPKPPEKSKGEKAREAYYTAFGKPGGGGSWETLSADRKAGWEAAAAAAESWETCK